MIDPTDQKTRSLLDELPAPGFRGVNPPMVGWYPARRVEHIERAFESRRWWNGTGWSIPCPVGADNEAARDAMSRPSVFRNDQIEWTGLAVPRLDYPYLLEMGTEAEALKPAPELLEAQRKALTLLYGNDAAVEELAKHSEPGPKLRRASALL